MEILNCTISNNFADDRAGGVYTATFSYPILKNCIIYNNGASEYQNMYSSGDDSFRISYSDIEESWFGEGNIDLPPLFTDPQNNDYSLSWIDYPVEDSTMSPCIDAGDPESPSDPDDTIADMGCFYFDQSGSPILVGSQDTLDFGEVIIGDTTTLFLTLYNAGEVDVMIDSIILTDDQPFSITGGSSDSLIIPGDSLVIFVNFAPGENAGYQEALQIFSNAEPISILLTGTGVDENHSRGNNQIGDSEFHFYSPFPNPSNSETIIGFELPASGKIKVELFGIGGRKISTLLEGIYNAGFHNISIDASKLSAGIYFAKITWRGNFYTQKMVILK